MAVFFIKLKHRYNDSLPRDREGWVEIEDVEPKMTRAPLD